MDRMRSWNRAAVFRAVATVGLVLAGFVLTSTAPGAAEALPSRLVLGATRPGGAWYALAVVLADIFKRELGIDTNVLQTGAVANIEGVNNGLMHLAFAESHIAAHAFKGVIEYNRRYENIAGLFNVFPGATQILARADAGIGSVSDLRGKRLGTPIVGTVAEVMTRQILEAYGLGYSQMRRVQHSGYEELAQLLQDGHLDVIFANGPVPHPQLLQAATARPMRLISLDEPKARELAARYDFTVSTIKGGTYPGTPEDVVVVGNDAIMIVQRSLPDELVTRLLEAIFKNADRIRAVHSTVASFSVETAAKPVGIPLHPAAQRFFRQAGRI
mgnify:CR=1 FL=1